MKLQPEPFQKIRCKEKTIELRLLDEKRQLIISGDEIEFTNLGNEDEKLTVRVGFLHKFSSFSELYKALPLDKCGYNSSSIKEASPSDMDAYYSVAEQSRYGVVGIEFELL